MPIRSIQYASADLRRGAYIRFVQEKHWDIQLVDGSRIKWFWRASLTAAQAMARTFVDTGRLPKAVRQR